MKLYHVCNDKCEQVLLLVICGLKQYIEIHGKYTETNIKLLFCISAKKLLLEIYRKYIFEVTNY